MSWEVDLGPIVVGLLDEGGLVAYWPQHSIAPARDCSSVISACATDILESWRESDGAFCELPQQTIFLPRR